MREGSFDSIAFDPAILTVAGNHHARRRQPRGVRRGQIGNLNDGARRRRVYRRADRRVRTSQHLTFEYRLALAHKQFRIGALMLAQRNSERFGQR